MPDGYEFVVVWFSFVYMFSWIWSDTDLEQMLKKKEHAKIFVYINGH